MGAGIGGSYGNTTGSGSRTLSDNLPELTEKYPVTSSGYFGVKGNRGKVRNIVSDNALQSAHDFWYYVNISDNLNLRTSAIRG